MGFKVTKVEVVSSLHFTFSYENGPQNSVELVLNVDSEGWAFYRETITEFDSEEVTTIHKWNTRLEIDGRGYPLKTPALRAAQTFWDNLPADASKVEVPLMGDIARSIQQIKVK